MHIKLSSKVTKSQFCRTVKIFLLHLGRNLQSVVDDDVISSLLDGIFVPSCI